MKIPVILFLVTVIIETYGQSDNKFPFQVLESKNTFDKKGKEIRRFDFLSSRDVIHLKNGDIYLVHYTGLPVHFTGDTTIWLKTLNEDFKMASVKIGEHRPDIQKLFSNSPLMIGMIHDYQPLFIVPPPRTNMSLNVGHDLCLTWKEGKTNKYKVTLNNIFLDSLATYYSESNSITIPGPEIEKLPAELDILVISLRYMDGSNRQFEMRCDLLNSTIPGLLDCGVNTAEKAIMIGYFLEIAGEQEESEKYYTLATTLSTDNVFQEILNCFFNRRN